MKEKGLEVKRLAALLCMLCLVAVTAAACSSSDKLNAKFADRLSADVFYVGDTVDITEYLVKVEGADYEVTFSYFNKTTGSNAVDTLEGRTYTLMFSGDYEISYTVTLGDKSDIVSQTIRVRDTLPVVTEPLSANVFVQGTTLPLTAILNSAGVSIASDTEYDSRIVSVLFRERQPVSLIPTAPNQNDEEITDLSSAKEFTFTRAGDYVFTFSTENAGGSVDSVFTVIAIEDVDVQDLTGVEAAYNASFAKSGQNYDSTTVQLLGNRDYNNASYAALSKNYKAGELVKIEFYGKNMPQIGYLTDNRTAIGTKNYGMMSGKGLIFSFERKTDRYILLGPTKMASDHEQLKQSGTTGARAIERFGFDDFEDGKHYFFEFGIIGSESTYNPVTKLYASANLYWYLYEKDSGGNITLVAQCAEGYEYMETPRHDGIPSEGQVVFYSSLSRDVTFKYHYDGLFGQTPSNIDINYDNATKTVSWTGVDGAAAYWVIVNGERVAYVDSQTTQYPVGAYVEDDDFIRSYDVKIVPSIGYNALYPHKFSTAFISAPNGYDDYSVGGGTIDTISMTARIQGIGAPASGQQSKSTYAGISEGFAAILGSYGAGTFVDANFTGKNMPQICFFANDATGNITNSAGGKGIIIVNGLYAASNNAAVASYSNRLTVWGPERISADLSNGGAERLYVDTSTTPAIADSQLVVGKAYRVTAGTVVTNGKLCLYIALYDVSGTEDALLYEKYVSLGIEPGAVTAGNIVFYAGLKSAITEFSFSEPYYLTADTNGIVIGNRAVLLGTGTDGQSKTTHSAIEQGYMAFQGDYGVGTYVDVRFTGKNLPQVCFFANDATGNVTNSADGTGIIIVNGLYTPGGTAVASYSNRLTVWGPERISAELSSGGAERLYVDTSTPAIADSQLVAGKAYSVTAGTLVTNGKLCLYIALYDVSGTEDALLYEKYVSLGIEPGAVTAGNIVFYAGLKSAITEFTFSQPYEWPGSDYDTNGLIIGNRAVLLGTGTDGQSKTTHSAIEQGYMAFQGDYGVGTYVDVRFTGKNLPQVCFFANDATGNVTNSADGTGIIIVNGLYTPGGTAVASYSNRLTVWGPERISADLSSGGAERLYVDTSTPAIADSQLVTGQEYRYVVGIADDDGTAYLDLKLYTVAGNVETIVYEKHVSLGLASNTVAAGNIVLYSGFKSAATTFEFQLPYNLG